MAESLRSIIEGMECTCHHCCQYLEANGTVPCDCSCVKCRLLAVLTEEKVDLVKKWKNIADQFSHGPMPNPLARSVFLRCAVELETWLAVNLERIKAQARLEGRRASLDYVSGVIAGCSKFGEDEVLKGCVEEEYERIAALEAQAKGEAMTSPRNLESSASSPRKE